MNIKQSSSHGINIVKLNEKMIEKIKKAANDPSLKSKNLYKDKKIKIKKNEECKVYERNMEWQK